MKTIEQWFAHYGESHVNKTNILIHKICVPFILFSILGLFWRVHLPGVHFFNLSMVLSLISLTFYFKLGTKPFMVMIAQFISMFLVIKVLDQSLNSPFYFYSGIFVIAWILQFVGHKIEGKKPSFLEDLQFLLIGPLWVLKSVFFKEIN